MDVHKIAIPTPYKIGDVNAFLVKGDALTIFDVGPKTTEAYEALQWGIRAAGYTMKDVEQVVLTHHHPDHAGWTDAFPHAAIMGHVYNDLWLRHDEDFLNYHEAFYRHNLFESGVPGAVIEKNVQVRREMEWVGTLPLTKILADGDEIPGHKGLKAIETLGHARSHLIFWDERSHDVIGGDLLLERITPNPLIEPPLIEGEPRAKSQLEYNASLALLRELPVATMYTGHGADLTQIVPLIDARMTRQHDQALTLYELIGQDEVTPLEATSRFYPRVYQKQFGLTLSKTIGALDYLESLGMLGKVQRAGIYYYKRVK
ncbi:Metallo-beta-lactamase superfamily protein [Metalysinibacillus saudimassiliensis]|uniref:Metallo-beta-lactamase superfamily protein n=1 Tax=Metalysinibacillus saudimassiliensis TaxID=1461583 RepID=A0A078LYR2_9BACL|nr:Metallo-beta-lactamase superfamily protein [Metalysinibacillus saudimassiliensis]